MATNDGSKLGDGSVELAFRAVMEVNILPVGRPHMALKRGGVKIFQQKYEVLWVAKGGSFTPNFSDDRDEEGVTESYV